MPPFRVNPGRGRNSVRTRGGGGHQENRPSMLTWAKFLGIQSRKQQDQPAHVCTKPSTYILWFPVYSLGGDGTSGSVSWTVPSVCLLCRIPMLLVLVLSFYLLFYLTIFLRKKKNHYCPISKNLCFSHYMWQKSQNYVLESFPSLEQRKALILKWSLDPCVMFTCVMFHNQI